MLSYLFLIKTVPETLLISARDDPFLEKVCVCVNFEIDSI